MIYDIAAYGLGGHKTWDISRIIGHTRPDLRFVAGFVGMKGLSETTHLSIWDGLWGR
jgi:hypothetical protein